MQKNLNNSGGKFFYCKDIQNLKDIRKINQSFRNNKLYCSDNKLQNTFNLDSLTVKLDNTNNYQGIITNCEFIIWQGKVMLSSEQIQNKNI